MARLIKKGRISFLRAHETGTKFGPADDKIDVEVVVRLDTAPDEAYGFQLRADAREPAHRAMFDLLRDSFNAGRTVQLDVDIPDGKKHGIVIRVTVLPAPLRPAEPVGGGVFAPFVVTNPNPTG